MTDQPAPICAWCEKPFTRPNAVSSQVVCSRRCGDAWFRYGSSPTKRQVEARAAHIASQPKGCATVADFLAAGGIVYREDAPSPPVEAAA